MFYWVGEAGWVARSFGVHPQTACRWFRVDRMPVPARRVPSGTIVVDPPGGDGSGRTVAYVRVSSPDQRPDLGARAGRGGRVVCRAGRSGGRGRVGGRVRDERAATETGAAAARPGGDHGRGGASGPAGPLGGGGAR